MAHLFMSVSDVQPAIAPTSGASGAIVGLPVNGTGYDRVCFIFGAGAPTATATLDAKVWESATSGGTYTSRASASLTQMTSGVATSTCATIDLSVDSAKPWLKISGSIGTSTWPLSAVAVTYRPSAPQPPGTYKSQQNVQVA